MSVRSKPNREGEAPAEPERDGSELPEGWASTTVAAVIENFQPGFASGDKNVEFGVSHLRMNNIGLVGELILDLVRTVPEKLAKPRHDLRPGDVLVCTTNSGKLVGKCSLFDLEGRYAFSNHLTRLRPNREVIDGSFLRWCLWSRWKAGAFDDKCKHWVNQSTIPKDALLEADIPLPPLAEQRRIVGKLELLLGKVSSSPQRLSRVPGLLKRFRQSVLAAACSGKLTADWRDENEDVETATELLERLQTERRKTWLSAHTNRKYQEPDRLEDDDLEAIPESWLWTNFDHCASEITVGHVGPMKDRYVDSGVAFLRSQNVRPLRFDPMGLVRIPKDFQAELTKSRLVGGEILVVRSGPTPETAACFREGWKQRTVRTSSSLVRSPASVLNTARCTSRPR